MLAVSQAGERVARLNGQIELHVATWRMKPAVEALMALRGIQIIAATVLLAELGDLSRFAHPRQLMAYLGLSQQRTKHRQLPASGSDHQVRQSTRPLVLDRVRPALRLAAEGEPRTQPTPGRPAPVGERAKLESPDPAPPPLLDVAPARPLPAESRRRRGPPALWLYLGLAPPSTITAVARFLP